MAKNNEGQAMGLGAEMTREGYKASVVGRMVGRPVHIALRDSQEMH